MKTAACAIGLAILATAAAQDFHPDIPRAWDDKDVAGLELPLVQRDRTPRYMTAEEYYKLKVRPIYRSYPVYAEGKEPPGYIESLKQKEPEVIFEPSKLHSRQDWIQAGKIVFEAPIVYRPARLTSGGRKVPPAFSNWVSSEGVLPGSKSCYVIRKRGVLEMGSVSCAACHTRLMPDKTFLEGAQGNFPDGVLTDFPARPPADRKFLEFLWIDFGAPWVQARADFDRSMLAIGHADQYGGVLSRQGTSAIHPPRIPSLIGIKDIKYSRFHRFGATPFHRRPDAIRGDQHRPRHSGVLWRFPAGYVAGTSGMGAEDGTRYSDEQLYALALYVYSLKPPPNPNPVDEHARRGERVFQREGCAGCHTPPLYTNNKLTPAAGFKVPDDLRKSLDILNISVGTDPVLANQTRRGTGFYKIPSLRGVWYRNGFSHGGNADTLEEWFDPARLREDYVPKGYHRGPGPIKGHEFGLKLGSGDRQDLIAFLRTL